jgi:predicted ester cyclase
MNPQEMKDTTRRWFRAIFDNGDYSLIPEMTTEDYGLVLPRTGRVSREDLPGMIEGFRGAIPGYHNEIHEQIVEGNVVVTRGTTHATHTGPLGDLPPTGNVIESDWIVITRFEGDKIAEDFEVWDEMGMMMQMGAINTVE